MKSKIVKAAILCMALAFIQLPCNCKPFIYSTPHIIERCGQCFRHIPDHRCVRAEDLAYLSDELYYNIEKSHYVPEVCRYLGGIGDDEFLYYFVSGQDGSPDYDKIIVTNATVLDQDSCTADVMYYIYDELLLIHTSMILKNGDWVIDDFHRESWTPVKEDCRSYITNQKQSFRSGEMETYIRTEGKEWSGQTDEQTEDSIRQMKRDWNDFFLRYPGER